MAGFECELAEMVPKGVQAECPICLLVLREPYQAICCGKSFCKKCIERVKDRNGSCPTCKTENFFSYPNKGLKHSLYDFEVYCSHKSKGCEWRGELRELDKHLNSEPAADKSLEGCPFTVIRCPLCCEMNLPRRSLTSHWKDKSLPCAQMIQLTARLEEIKRIQTFPLQIEEQFITGSPPADSESVTDIHVLPVRFILTHFEQHRKADDRLYSLPFYTHHRGYKMRLEVLANGWAEGKGTHISVFVHLMRGEFDEQLKWPFRGEITVALLNQKEKDGSPYTTRIIPFDDTTRDSTASRVVRGEVAESGRGFCKFASHADLRANYMKIDCLVMCIQKVSYFTSSRSVSPYHYNS